MYSTPASELEVVALLKQRANVEVANLSWVTSLPTPDYRRAMCVLDAAMDHEIPEPVKFIAKQLVSRAGGGTKTTVHAVANNGLRCQAIGAVLVFGGKSRLHGENLFFGLRLRWEHVVQTPGVEHAMRIALFL